MTGDPAGRFSHATRAFALFLLLGLVTGLIEGGHLAVQQHVVHHLTFASVDAPWMAPVAYALLFGALAVPVALLARLAPSWCTTRVILGLGITIVAFSLLLLWTGRLLSVYTLVLVSIGVGVQLGRMLAPLLERHQRRVVPLTGALLCLVGGVALLGTARERWRGYSGTDSSTIASADAPNVLLIILDTVRAASLSLYGYGRPTSPRLAEFAAGGVIFDSAYTVAPWTLPSHASMFTGLYHQDLSTDWLVPLDGAPRTLAEAFAASGYATGGFVGNLPYTSRESGLDRGFETYRDHKRTPLQLMLSATLFGTAREWWLFGNRRAHRDDDRKEGPRVTAEFLGWLDHRRPPRFFVFLNYFDAHLPLPGIPRGSAWDSGRRKLDSYDGAIARTDGYLGAVLDSLAARGVLDKTLVIIVSDHGTLLGEHGLTAHGNSLYQLLLHVPLVIRGPGVPAGRRLGTPVSLRDLAETVRHTAGLSQSPFPGTSLQPLWQARSTGPLSPLLAQVRKGINPPPQEPIKLGTMTSLIVNGQHYVLGGQGREELFDLGSDPAEDHNLAPEVGSQPVLDALRDSLRTLKRPGWGGAPDPPPRGTPGAAGS